jgi:hypothetical protein
MSEAVTERSPAKPGQSVPGRHLFVAGCPRSGTSAVAFLLNEHRSMAIGFERYKRTRGVIEPMHFEPEHFFSPLLLETDSRGELLYARLRERYDRGEVLVAGDKVPLYTRVLPQLFGRFPHGKVIVMVRDLHAVAASFARRAADPEDWWPAENDHGYAVTLWNETLAHAREAERAGWGSRLLLLPYEAFFAGEMRWLEALFGFLELPLTTRVRAEYERMARPGQAAPALDAAVRAELDEGEDRELSRWARDRMARELAEHPRAPVPAEGEDEAPLTAAEIEAREGEREQLLAEMRAPGRHAPDELEVLERRFLGEARRVAALLDRAARAVEAREGSGDGSEA